MKKLLLFLFFAFFAFSWQANAQYFTEDFENGGTFPTNWTLSPGTGDDWAIDQGDDNGPGSAQSGTYCAFFNDYDYSSGTVAEMITPNIDLSGATAPQLKFWYYDAGGNDDVEVLVSTDGTNYTLVYTTPTTVDPWTEFTVDLSAYAGQAMVTISWRGTSVYGYSNPHVDNITIDEPPACPDPSAQTESNITKSSADLGWTENGSANTWDIEWGAPGFTQGTGTMVTGVTNPYNLSGLSAATSYDWYVRADCGASGGSGQSAWVGPHTFSTMDDGYTCDFPLVINALPYNTSDNTSNYGDDYDNGDSPCNNYYLSGDDVVYSYTPAADECVDITLSNLDDTYSGIHVLDGCPIGTATCMAFEGNSNTNDRVLSGVNLTAGTTYYIVISTWAAPQSVGYTLDIDNCPTCSDPTNQAESNITSTTVDLSWTENSGNTAWEIEYGATGFTQGSGTTVAVTANPYTLSGLTASAGYDWYVRSDCGSGMYSNWVGPHNFVTAPTNDDCSGAIALTVGNPGDCPTNQVTTDASSATADGNTSCDTYGDNIGVWFSFVAPATGEVVVNYTAGTATGNPGITIFDACGGAEVAGTCQDNPATLSNITGLTGGTTYYMLLWFDGASAAGSFDICLEDVGSCPKPTGQTEANITATSADLDWIENGTATTWDIEWGATGFAQGSGTMVIGITTKPHTLSGLTANTDYDWYVRADCGGGSLSPWEGPHTFTTSPPPPANDDCSSATVLNCGDNLTGETTEGATDNGDDTGCGMGKGVWYKYVAANIYELTVTATPVAGYDIELSVSSSSDCTAFTNLACKDSGGSGGAETYTFTTTVGTTYYFYIAHYSNTSTVTGDFDIALSCVTCIDPSGQTETNITPTSADLDWTENGGASTWEIEWGVQGFTQGSGTIVTGISSKPYNLSGLTALTDYDWYVRSDCGGGDFSNWTGPHTFTTTSADAVDWCNLQYPDAATITAGGSVDVFAQVYEPGVTDAAGQGAGITAWIGYSTTDTDPSTWTDWIAATYNVDAGNNDEYQAALGAGLAPGTYYYASRFKLNAGAYKYGGYSAGGGGFWDGSTYVSGVLTVNHIDGDDCADAIVLTQEDAPTCSNATSGTVENATDSGIPAPECDNYTGTANDDVWYSFIAKSADLSIELDDNFDGVVELFSGTCGSLTHVDCKDTGTNPTIEATGLTIDDTYYVRVYAYSSSTPSGTNAEFTICVYGRYACPDMSSWTVLPANSNTITSASGCVDGDWTHFYNGTNILLSLKLGSSGAVITDVTVDPDGATDAQWFDNDADGFPQVAGETGAAFMKRKWDVNASTQPSSDVGVRFYYTDDEYDAVNTVLTANGDAALTGKNGMSFYKVTTSEDPFNISPGGIAQGDYVMIKHGATAGIDTWIDGTYGTENYAEYNVSGFSGGGAGSGSAGKSIPIELLSFTGYADKDANILKWTTLSEINTSMFYVERSEFGKEWTAVAKVEASGNSLSKKDYKVADKEPVTKAFYRLRSIDRDGKYTISKVITIERKETGLRLNAVYPNPNNGNFVVNLTSLPGEKGQIVLINALGIKVYTKGLNTKGGRTIEKINVNQLPNGIYTLMLEQNSDIITKRVVINK